MKDRIDSLMHEKMTYGQAVGYIAGQAAAKIPGGTFLGLSHDEWMNATDDYAQGYRRGYKAIKELK